MLNSLRGKRKKKCWKKESTGVKSQKKKLDCKKNKEMDGVKANELNTVALFNFL